jgi:hypothetical protein
MLLLKYWEKFRLFLFSEIHCYFNRLIINISSCLNNSNMLNYSFRLPKL